LNFSPEHSESSLQRQKKFSNFDDSGVNARFSGASGARRPMQILNLGQDINLPLCDQPLGLTQLFDDFFRCVSFLFCRPQSYGEVQLAATHAGSMSVAWGNGGGPFSLRWSIPMSMSTAACPASSLCWCCA
jgi:hypothetical protein